MSERLPFLAPEVVQTSMMDCGPAALKCVLSGFGVDVAYGRLREACQTDVDGTSIDVIEDVAFDLGLQAEQVIIPEDHLLIPEAEALPAIIVVTLPGGATHFIVVWRRLGPWVQIMDPTVGRVWLRAKEFRQRLYHHAMPVPAEAWRAWGETTEFLGPLRRRLDKIGVKKANRRRLIDAALEDEGPMGLAQLDAAVRMTTAFVDAEALRTGGEAASAVAEFFEADPGRIPDTYWRVVPQEEASDDGEEEVVIAGAVVVRLHGRRDIEAAAAEALSPELAAALEEPAPRPLATLGRMLAEDGFLHPVVLLVAVLFAAAGVVVQGLVLRGLLDITTVLVVPEQRLGAIGIVIAFFAGLALLEYPIASGARRLGRRLEARMRAAFLEKLPRLHDRYFSSRLVSDMAERAHSLRLLNQIPTAATNLIQAAAALLFTTAALTWLAPGVGVFAVAAAVAVVVVPVAVQPLLNERDLRVRTHIGALSRFYLDALLGVIPIRTHGAGGSVRREHEGLLADWQRAELSLLGVSVFANGLQALLGIVLAVGLVVAYLDQSAGDAAGTLLIVYWSLALPGLGSDVAAAIRRYPALRNVFLRCVEPLEAPDARSETRGLSAPVGPLSLEFDGVDIVAGGHRILANVDVRIDPGEHVAIVGPSGAGKSTLIRTVLGFHRPASGKLQIGDVSLETIEAQSLREAIAWVDPAVQIWNRSLIDNVAYGNTERPVERALGRVIETSELREVLERLPDGLQTELGENGGMVSGGEGQRVRLARGLMRGDPGLVLLDEAFRGLDRKTRADLLDRARRWWSDATLLFATHDLRETREFDRVLVIEDGCIVEDGAPDELLAGDSHYAGMVEAERELADDVWRAPFWRHVDVTDGHVDARPGTEEPGDADRAVADDLPRPGDIEDPQFWKIEDGADAIRRLCGEAGIGAEETELPPPPSELTVPLLSTWLETAAPRLGCRLEEVAVDHDELPELLSGGGPAILLVEDGNGDVGLALLLGRSLGKAELLTPDLRRRRVDLEELRRRLVRGPTASLREDFDALVATIGLSDARREHVLDRLVADQLGGTPVVRAWLLRLPPDAPLSRHLSVAGLPRQLAALSGTHLIRHGIFLVSWWLIGSSILLGRSDTAMLAAWGLALATTVPLSMVSSWYQGLASMTAGRVLKQHLLTGALRIEPSTIRGDGPGRLMAQVFESEAVESMALSGGFGVITGAVELAFAMAVLVLSPVGIVPILAVVGWTGVMAAATWILYRRQSRWTASRLDLTHETVEAMVGHRTRLAQANPETWHDDEDRLLEHYYDDSRSLDSAAVGLSALIGRGWLVVGMASLIPVLLQRPSLAGFAAGLGGVLLAGRALAKLTSAATSLNGAVIAFRQAEPLFRAAGNAPDTGSPSALTEAMTRESERGEMVLSARDMTFSYPGRTRPALDGCSLDIRAGDRVLIEGESGGGKSTLASLMVGLRRPDSGMLLLDGLDRETLGLAGWRQRAVAVPQFHENHILAAPLAFNLLMGEEWPADWASIERAREVCEELGLGPLIRRMPAGMLQMVGETGWQLSHGERSRLYIARALLQDAEVVVFDESFAALDPDNLRRVMDTVLRRSRTAVVIAHP